MMSNVPIPMLWQELDWQKTKKVLVYDFLHETIETFQTFALCWVPSTHMWLTIPISALKPDTKTVLKEDITNE